MSYEECLQNSAKLLFIYLFIFCYREGGMRRGFSLTEWLSEADPPLPGTRLPSHPGQRPACRRASGGPQGPGDPVRSSPRPYSLKSPGLPRLSCLTAFPASLCQPTSCYCQLEPVGAHSTPATRRPLSSAMLQPCGFPSRSADKKHQHPLGPY